jgi:hypothetical protein
MAATPVAAPGLRWLRSELRRSAAMMNEAKGLEKLIVSPVGFLLFIEESSVQGWEFSVLLRGSLNGCGELASPENWR